MAVPGALVEEADKLCQPGEWNGSVFGGNLRRDMGKLTLLL
jgi:hypothetical protein